MAAVWHPAIWLCSGSLSSLSWGGPGSHKCLFCHPPEPANVSYRLNSARQVSWYTLVAVIMDVARRGLQFVDPAQDLLDPHLLYIVPRFTFTPLAAAAAQNNLFVYPQFELDKTRAVGDLGDRECHLLGGGQRRAVAARRERRDRGSHQPGGRRAPPGGRAGQGERKEGLTPAVCGRSSVTR